MCQRHLSYNVTLSDVEGALCADDPVTDAEWTSQYEQEMQEIRAHEERMRARLDEVVEPREWYGHSYFIMLTVFNYVLYTLNNNLICFYRCSCGNCSLELLQNVSECSCCREIQGVIEHPGFSQFAFKKWSLKQGAWKYKTKGNKRYKQTESEER